MLPLPTLTQLKHFVALHDAMNFTRAADACFVTQSTLSASIRELEATLNVRLVERDKRNVAFTDVGVDVVRRARALLADAQDLATACQSSHAIFHGRLVLSAIPTIAPFVFPRLLTELRRRYKNAQIYLREEQTHLVLEHVRTAHAEIGVIALPFEIPDSLHVIPFADDPFLYVSSNASTPPKRSVTITQLQHLPLLLLEDGHCLRDHAITACRLSDETQNRAVSATSLSTLIQMVESGLGNTLLPQLAIQGGLLKGRRLYTQPLTPKPPARTLAVIVRKTSARQREAELIAQMLASHVN